MVAIVLLALLSLLLFGVGFTVHILWWVAFACVIVWLLGFAFRSGGRRWYYW